MPASYSVQKKQLFSQLLLAMSSIVVLGALPASAQTTPTTSPYDVANELSQTTQTPTPPPPGSPGTPAGVTAGDTGTNPAVPTGTADTTPGTNFPTGTRTTDSMVRIFKDETAIGRGLRMVQTLMPASLTAQQLAQVQGILGNITTGEPVIDVTATAAQLEQLNIVMAPYPQAQMNGNGRKVITTDAPAQGYPKETPNYDFQGPLPTVRTFCRYLVILGVVCSTVFMAKASWGMICGHPYAGNRAIASASGLMLLLMGYTIWKIVQMNTFKDNTNDPPVISQKSNQGQATTLPTMNLPVVPNVPNGVARSPLPVAPLSGN